MNLDFDAVQEVLETRVAPQLALHGGGVKLCSISPEGDIRVAFKGACATCPSMTETMDALVMGQLRAAFPDTDEELLQEARNILRELHKKESNER